MYLPGIYSFINRLLIGSNEDNATTKAACGRFSKRSCFLEIIQYNQIIVIDYLLSVFHLSLPYQCIYRYKHRNCR